MHVCGDVSYIVYRAIKCMYVEGFVTVCIWLHTACIC